MAKLLIKLPSRSRPAKFMEVFNLYKNMASGKHDVRFLCSFDLDDATMNNPGMRNWIAKQGDSVKAFWGNSKTKIQAINADLEHAGDYDVLLLASDDMIPQMQDYDDIIIQDMQTYYPDGDGVLHYNDGKQGERLNTLCIMGKKYFDRFGYIYNPEYISVYPDNEFTDVSRILGKATYIDKVIIRHFWIEIGVDALYMRNENRELYARDGALYQKRKEANFGLSQHANAS
jgi:hypothetical protein